MVVMEKNILSVHRLEVGFSYGKNKAQKKPPQGQGEPAVAGVVRSTPIR